MSRAWMPLYVGDYLADTAHLRAAESGAYLHLIMHYWQHGALPDEDRKLAAIARMSDAEWKRSRETMASFFDAGWRHGRIDDELAKANFKHDRRVEAGRRGGIASANAKQPSSNACSNAEASSQSQPEKKEDGANAPTARARKTPLPHDFVPDRELPRSVGWSESAIDQQIERFKDSARAHKRLYADWPAAWRNWVRSPFQTAEKPNGSANAKRTVHQAAAEQLERVRSQLERAQLERVRALDSEPPGLRDGTGESVVRLLPARGRE
jgi:uncharacterized protein YdaU (DUF1376 family)